MYQEYSTFLLTVTSAVAYFTNEACVTGGVRPSEPLLFTCKVYGIVVLRVRLPTGDQEIISLGDTTTDVALPTGFAAVSLDIREIDDSTRNYNLTLSIDSASRLKGGNITCDDTTPGNVTEARCPISKPSQNIYRNSEVCKIILYNINFLLSYLQLHQQWLISQMKRV